LCSDTVFVARAGLIGAWPPAVALGRCLCHFDQRLGRVRKKPSALLWYPMSRKAFKMLFKYHLKNRYLGNLILLITDGRVFKDLVGLVYILIVPLGSVLFLALTLGGVYSA
jgi:hypothetical protein